MAGPLTIKLSKRQKRDAKEAASYVEVCAGARPLPHAHLVEYGSVHNPTPAPFMRPAWDSLKGSLLGAIKEDLWTEIQRAVSKLARKAARGGE